MKRMSLAFVAMFIVYSLQARFIPETSTIHVIGESHSHIFGAFSNQLPIAIHDLPAITMHRIGRDGFNAVDLKKWNVKEHDVVVFVCGEVDVRCHIGRQRDLFARNEDEIIGTLASKYFNTVIGNKNMYQDLLCIVYCVVPPCDRAYNTSYPFYGTLHDRITLTRKLNAKLTELGKHHHIPVLNVSNLYCDAQGALKFEMSDGGIHLNGKYALPIQQELVNIIKNNFLN